ncbi:MAG: hypothetical protein Q8764_01870 [Pigeon pea little leaf phytoplasma]|uniref:5'-3' exonuclease alpha-helical arch N-terminal domain-containing protein n=1 Tax=Candidatus Phytoplasma fabacearum TaxID=2982628 RepID=A0ABU8ZTL0_9MOLU|nr:hypothetical protein ['Bituminaria bituminosa' little leaf phytoplasma]MDV3149099.1 hypothetical protein [Pigeon pea little leaf phytoplasma]MDO7983742.1 hypothetical protein ['Bituminaria bituminosa' little leaf phytoplasma]MDO8024053.1 hypothetical protein ['Bituminaria bituminosa' little leaf phytoplasma]MDO8030762.1 hypothetical protein ['Bituminaria bituminosa' little leaf phytoplasma]MDV3154210.1 hypothetical protein [Pigeon pea little leaf phytoplasma]
MKNLILVDGHALIFRAYYATTYKQNINDIKNENNNNLNKFNALMIFINMFEKILEKTQNHILVAFDTQGKTKKKEIYLDYKKGRPLIPQLLIDQIVLVQEYLKISGVKYHYQTGGAKEA